jgi:hypothetical protein
VANSQQAKAVSYLTGLRDKMLAGAASKGSGSSSSSGENAAATAAVLPSGSSDASSSSGQADVSDSPVLLDPVGVQLLLGVCLGQGCPAGRPACGVRTGYRACLCPDHALAPAPAPPPKQASRTPRGGGTTPTRWPRTTRSYAPRPPTSGATWPRACCCATGGARATRSAWCVACYCYSKRLSRVRGGTASLALLSSAPDPNVSPCPPPTHTTVPAGQVLCPGNNARVCGGACGPAGRC